MSINVELLAQLFVTIINVAYRFKAKGRHYRVGNKMVELTASAIKTFIKWNTGNSRAMVAHDKQIVKAILLKCEGSAKLARGEVSEHTRQFIEGIKYTY